MVEGDDVLVRLGDLFLLLAVCFVFSSCRGVSLGSCERGFTLLVFFVGYLEDGLDVL